jgi:predicted DNA-binding protein
MGKYKENPKYNIVSLRVSDEERQNLEELSRATNRRISDLMREALHSLTLLRLGA